MVSSGTIREFLHFSHTGQDEPLKLLLDTVKNCEKWCPFNHSEADPNCYTLFEGVNFVLDFIKKYSICFDFLEINPHALSGLSEIIEQIKNPLANSTSKAFKEHVDRALHFIRFYKKFFHEKIRLLTCEESYRLDEALECLQVQCHFACVVMAVSAVESRLRYLLKKKNKTVFNAEFEKATLGQIIKLFDENEYTAPKYAKLKKILPDKHKPLMNLLNQYRIFSAHPKAEIIGRNIAESILRLSFVLLLDKDLIVDIKIRQHKP